MREDSTLAAYLSLDRMAEPRRLALRAQAAAFLDHLDARGTDL